LLIWMNSKPSTDGFGWQAVDGCSVGGFSRGLGTLDECILSENWV
jgi:hypothetical protein